MGREFWVLELVWLFGFGLGFFLFSLRLHVGFIHSLTHSVTHSSFSI